MGGACLPPRLDEQELRLHPRLLTNAEEAIASCSATFGRSVSKTEWVYGFKVSLSVSPEGVITSYRLALANCDERPIGEFLVSCAGLPPVGPRLQA